MSLYLCVFDDDQELDGVEVGAYEDFGRFRDTIMDNLERGDRGSRFPVLQLHADSDGEWSVDQCKALEMELLQIEKELARYPAGRTPEDDVGEGSVNPPQARTLAESFSDVDGINLFTRLRQLCESAMRSNRPILFQ